jgi:AcrR family transcriptional regulator
MAATRERLLEAAGRVFSERGFRKATVREIVARAGANVAAVNYHFRDKAGLYALVLEHSFRAAVERHPPGEGLRPGAPPEEQLRAFVRSLLRRLLERGPQAVHAELMAREMVEPTAALEPLARDVIRPLYERLLAILRALAGPRGSAARLKPAARSVVGQCLFYKLAAPMILRLEGRLPEGAREIEALADHITEFSLGGLRGLRRAR